MWHPPQKRKFTKEDAIYGIFKESDDDYSGKDYTRPVNFVSSGSLMGAESFLENVEEETDHREEATASDLPSYSAPRPESAELPTSFGAVSPPRKKQANKETVPQPAVWERYTKGIGSKLMAAMGYTGSGGLGKQGEGMAKPIEVKLRPKNLGLSYGNFKERVEEGEEYGYENVDASTLGYSESEKELQKLLQHSQDLAPKEPGWKKSTKRKVVYKTALDVTQKRAAAPQTECLVIDMTQPQVRVVPTAQALGRQREVLSKQQPELQYNVRMLVDLAELDIRNLDYKIKHVKERLRKKDQEYDRVKLQVEAEADHLKQMKEIHSIVERCVKNSKRPEDQGGMALSSIINIFKLLRHKFSDEFESYNLAGLGFAVVFPILKQRMRMWSPLEEPNFLTEEFQGIREFLDTLQQEKSKKPVKYFPLLCYHVMFRQIRSRILSEWNVREPKACIAFLEAWEDILPSELFQNILHQLIFPKLLRTVQDWDPTRDTVPINAWVQPWIPYFHTRMNAIYPTIRHKLGVVLQAWHPSDASAMVILAPWKGVFEDAAMDALLERCIVPKLAEVLHREFVVNPRNQNLQPFKWVMAWEKLLNLNSLVRLLEAAFFPSWYRALTAWLQQQPDLNEVSAWYMGWKKQFSADLIAHPQVRAHFNKGLQIMNAAVS